MRKEGEECKKREGKNVLFVQVDVKGKRRVSLSARSPIPRRERGAAAERLARLSLSRARFKEFNLHKEWGVGVFVFGKARSKKEFGFLTTAVFWLVSSSLAPCPK